MLWKRLLWLVVLVPPPVAALQPKWSDLQLLLVVLWAAVGLPLGFWLTVDWYKRSTSTSAVAIAGRFAAGLAISLTGLATLLVGLGLLAWIGVDLFRPQREAAGEWWHLGVPAAFVAVGISLLRLGWSKRGGPEGAA